MLSAQNKHSAKILTCLALNGAYGLADDIHPYARGIQTIYIAPSSYFRMPCLLCLTCTLGHTTVLFLAKSHKFPSSLESVAMLDSHRGGTTETNPGSHSTHRCPSFGGPGSAGPPRRPGHGYGRTPWPRSAPRRRGCGRCPP